MLEDTEILKGSETILLVDDEVMVLDMSQTLLERLGYRVITANSGMQAIDLVRQLDNQIDLVILDMIMPGMNGEQALESIRYMHPKMPVILASGYTLDYQFQEIINTESIKFIQKPYDIYGLCREIRKLLDSNKHSHPC